MSDDAIKRAEALLTLIRECVRFADWAAGQGIAPADGEPASAPEDVIMAFLDHVEVDWAAGFTDSVMAQLAVTAADLAGLAEGTHVVVPVEPTEAMWRGLARDLMMWQELGRPSGKNLYAHLKQLGKEPPDWLRREIPDIDWVPSKGDRAVVIYRAMIEARPGAKEAPDR